MIKTGVRYRCDRCGFERFVLDGSMSKAEKDKIAKEPGLPHSLRE